jgi:hypothetical protein
MRVSAVVLALAASATARNVFRAGGQSLAKRDELDVPGQNPLKFCEANRDDDLITIENVVLTPNPPEAYVYSPREAPGCPEREKSR